MMPNQMLGMLQQLKANPAQFLMQRRLNIPQGISADPKSILDYLVQTGKVSQQQINAAYQAAQRFR